MVLVRGVGVFGVFFQPLDANLSGHQYDLGVRVQTLAACPWAECSRLRLDGTNFTIWSLSGHRSILDFVPKG